MIRHNVTHRGEYNPWDMNEDERELADECVASGGFVYRTGTYNPWTGIHHGDGLQYVKCRQPEPEYT